MKPKIAAVLTAATLTLAGALVPVPSLAAGQSGPAVTATAPLATPDHPRRGDGELAPPPALSGAPSVGDGAPAPAEAAASAAFEGNEGTFHAVKPDRLLDTRSGLGARRGALPGGSSIDLLVAGRAGVPTTGVSAVVVNVTAVETTVPTWVAAWPTGAPRPATSNLNLRGGGENRANLVTVALGERGSISLFNAAGSAHLLVDVQGYYATADGALGGGYHPIEPTRAYDSRPWGEAWDPNKAYLVAVEVPGLDVARATSVVVNVTAVNPTADGYVGLFGPSGSGEVSNINFTARKDTPNLAVVPVGTDADGVLVMGVYNSNGWTDIVVDVLGWYDAQDTEWDGYRFTPSAPSRVLDTRTGIGGGALGGWTYRTAPTSAVAPNARAVVANVTGVDASATTWLGVSPEWGVPGSSTLNLSRGETRPNATVVRTNSGQSGFSVFNAEGSTHVLVDVFGWFE
ncbi:hypothetical protein [Thalassiella azotivora]